jgi:serine/threonine-protein kinase
MGIVYKVWHIPTGRVAALKQMRPISNADPTLVRRFYREVLINEQLIHPGLVRLFEAGLEGEHPYFVSEFVPDGNLNQFLSADDRPLLQPVDSAWLIAAALEGLEHVHQKGIVHRDIKPENILLRARGNGAAGAKSVRNLQPKLADFGLARSYERHGGTITRKDEYAGTIFYMPAEQIIAFKQCKPPVDVYAMGVTLYYLLTGRFPLGFPPPSQLKRGARLAKDPIRMILEDQPQPVRRRRPDLPAALCAVVDRAVARDAGQRYQTAREFRADLLKAVGD